MVCVFGGYPSYGFRQLEEIPCCVDEEPVLYACSKVISDSWVAGAVAMVQPFS